MPVRPPCRRLVRSLLVLVALASPPATAGADVSYRSLTEPKELKAFLADGGRSYRNQRVHLHLPAQVLLAEPDATVHLPRGGRLIRFKHKSVPLLVRPDNVYVRKIRQRAAAGDQLCVKGTVAQEPLAGTGRYALFVKTVKKAP